MKSSPYQNFPPLQCSRNNWKCTIVEMVTFPRRDIYCYHEITKYVMLCCDFSPWMNTKSKVKLLTKRRAKCFKSTVGHFYFAITYSNSDRSLQFSSVQINSSKCFGWKQQLVRLQREIKKRLIECLCTESPVYLKQLTHRSLHLEAIPKGLKQTRLNDTDSNCSGLGRLALYCLF